jgi:hypothetical protein
MAYTKSEDTLDDLEDAYYEGRISKAEYMRRSHQRTRKEKPSKRSGRNKYDEAFRDDDD